MTSGKSRGLGPDAWKILRVRTWKERRDSKQLGKELRKVGGELVKIRK